MFDFKLFGYEERLNWLCLFSLERRRVCTTKRKLLAELSRSGICGENGQMFWVGTLLRTSWIVTR